MVSPRAGRGLRNASSRRAGRSTARWRRAMASSMVTICRRGTGAEFGRGNWPAAAASATIGFVGGVRVRNTPIRAPSRSITPRRSEIMTRPTFSPALTETMDRPSICAEVMEHPKLPSPPRLPKLPGWASISDSAHLSDGKY